MIGDTCCDFLDRFTQSGSSLLSLCPFNAQSLNAYSFDITTDFVLSRCKLLSFSETWIENDYLIEMLDFRTVSRFKRNAIRSGGVAICENMSSSDAFKSIENDLIKFNREKMNMKWIATFHDDVEDIYSMSKPWSMINESYLCQFMSLRIHRPKELKNSLS